MYATIVYYLDLIYSQVICFKPLSWNKLPQSIQKVCILSKELFL